MALDYIFDEDAVLKEAGEWPEIHCSAEVFCNRCRVKHTTLKFTMSHPDYKLPKDVVGCFYGHDMRACMWYNGRIEKGWYRSSDVICCPQCAPKEKRHERWSLFWWNFWGRFF